MGQLLNGQWTKSSVITSDKSGAFVRKESKFRNWISKEQNFRPESNRYHLYVSYACPWAHRVLIMRELKDLKEHISVDVVHPDMMENGWSFNSDFENANGDTLYNKKYLYDINKINHEVYININNGGYKTGFAKTQSAYDEAVKSVFNTLDKVEEKLNSNNYLIGNQLTEADIRLVTTLLRFDNVYHYHFKCNLKKISDYKNLSRYLEKFKKLDCIKRTTFNDHIKRHYFFSHESINPTRIIPIGPIIL